MKVLELFAGTRSIGKAFEMAGHKVFSVDWDSSFEDIDLCENVMTVTPQMVIERFGLPDVVWASFDCTTFSIAGIGHHRRKNPLTGELDAVSEYAKECDKIDQYVLKLIDELQQEREKRGLDPLIYFIENPRGGLRKMVWMQKYPRYTITYCQYETDKPANKRRMKPTDIWTNHPNPQFRPMCKNGAACHEASPRHSRTGTQGLKNARERSVIPHSLCEHIVYICEKEKI